MIDLNVNINENKKSYPIHIFQDNIENLKAKILMNMDGRRFLVVISEKVENCTAKHCVLVILKNLYLKMVKKKKIFIITKKFLKKLLK